MGFNDQEIVALSGAHTIGRAFAAGAYTHPLFSSTLAVMTQMQTPNTPNSPYHPLNTPKTTPNCTPCHTAGAEVELKSGGV
jgi:hypothetical protein